MNNSTCYYVYVYIDPRNFEEFYYGKGKGSRKDAQLKDRSDKERIKRITAIKKEGLEPIIRVIAKDLTEREAFFVEKTLLWKLGKWTENISGGYFADKFRPRNTFHKKLSGFDFQNRIYYYNVGEGPYSHRDWDDYVRFNFISAGQGLKWRDAMLGFNEGDVVVAYLKRHGFVGIGRIKQQAKTIKEVTIKGKPLLSLPLQSQNMGDNKDNPELCEYVALVDWIKCVPRDQAKWRKSPKLYTTTHVRASLDGQQETLRFIEEQFDVSIGEIAEEINRG